MDRSTPKGQWIDLWRHLRRTGGKYMIRGLERDDPYIEKQRIIDAIAKYECDGRVLLCDRFMDCDCASSTSSREIPANYYAYIRAVEDIYSAAEGPGTTWLDYPGNIPESDFRDHALEAYEDGHPHVVYT